MRRVNSELAVKCYNLWSLDFEGLNSGIPLFADGLKLRTFPVWIICPLAMTLIDDSAQTKLVTMFNSGIPMWPSPDGDANCFHCVAWHWRCWIGLGKGRPLPKGCWRKVSSAAQNLVEAAKGVPGFRSGLGYGPGQPLQPLSYGFPLGLMMKPYWI